MSISYALFKTAVKLMGIKKMTSLPEEELIRRSRQMQKNAPFQMPKQEYDDLMDFYKTYSNTTIKNVFWSANNYELPHPAFPLDTEIVYWYGEKEKNARRGDMAYLKNYIPGVSFTQISGKEHGELLMVFPEEWYVHVSEFLVSGRPKNIG